MFNYIEEKIPEQYEGRMLVVLVLDTSGSMNADNNIKKLNDSLSLLKRDIMNDPVAQDCIELAIVSFNSKVEVVQQPDLLENVTIPVLQASGQTQLVAAIQEAQKIVDDRKAYYVSQGLPYYRPWIIVMTDGDPYPPGQDIDGLSAQIHTDISDLKYVLLAIGIGNDVQDEILKKLAKSGRAIRIPRMHIVRLLDYFDFISEDFALDLSSPSSPTPEEWINSILK